MSYQAMTWATKIRAGTPSAKAVLILLANYADHTGFCWPSQERLARELELTERTVRDALGRLEAKGIISRERRFDKDGFRASDGIRLNASYRQYLPLGPKGQPENISGNDGLGETVSGRDGGLPETISAPTGNKQPILPETISGELLREPQENNHSLAVGTAGVPKKAGKKPSYTDEFMILWEMVPKGDNPGSKLDAFKAWSKLDEADREACVKGWMKYLDFLEAKRESRADHPIKQCVSFINGRLWETYIEEAA